MNLLALVAVAALSWTQPTLNTDGSSITGAIAYNVLQCQETTEGTPCTPALTTNAAQNGVSGLSLSMSVPSDTTQCWSIVTLAEGAQSDPTTVLCQSFPTPGPFNVQIAWNRP